MYETELNPSSMPIESIPLNIINSFIESRREVEVRTVLPWGEHCTECNWPTCYRTCELYAPRIDGACRLFVGGVTHINNKHGLSPYIQRIRFKRWAKLWSSGSLEMFPLAIADQKEHRNLVVGTMLRTLPMPKSIKKKLLVKYGYLRRTRAENSRPTEIKPDFFLIECYNPTNREISLSLSIRTRALSPAMIYQKLIRVPCGYLMDKTPFDEVNKTVDLTQSFEVEIVPNDCSDKILFFGLMDFVRTRGEHVPQRDPTSSSPKWKCIVWDLDNTLWEGVLIEDGPDKLKLKHDHIRIIEETDRRGILHSIASKNNTMEALEVMNGFGISDYFLYPQISWQPKSTSIARIAKLLNIGVETIAFVDDQEFEREEVRSALPQIALIDARDCLTIPGRAECQVPVTHESMQRRTMYRQQEQRDLVQQEYLGDYYGFLRECNIELSIERLNLANAERVYELAQRTNQMNFSGNRYPREKLKEIMESVEYETFVIKCDDKFGSYGIIGFAVVAVQEPRMLDLMFSCRIQSKRVEHAFFSFLLNRYSGMHSGGFFANYRRTEKNTQAGKVFAEVGFEQVAEENGITSLVFKNWESIPDEAIIRVTFKDGC